MGIGGIEKIDVIGVNAILIQISHLRGAALIPRRTNAIMRHEDALAAGKEKQ
jgi:hypothetical protein